MSRSTRDCCWFTGIGCMNGSEKIIISWKCADMFSVPMGQSEICVSVWLAVALASALAAEPTPADQAGEPRHRERIEAPTTPRLPSISPPPCSSIPGYVDARLYLATSYMAQYVPGSEDRGKCPPGAAGPRRIPAGAGARPRTRGGALVHRVDLLSRSGNSKTRESGTRS